MTSRKLLLAIILPLTLAAPALADVPGPYKTFKDWIVGCSNLRACTALGLTAGGDAGGGYLTVTRQGGKDASPEVGFRVMADNPPPGATLRVEIAGGPGGATPPQVLPASAGDTAYVTASLTGDAALAFVRGLPEAESVHLSLEAGGKTVAEATVSLAGSAAAILFFDDTQGRVGTVSALLKKGEIADSAVPPIPAEPVLRAATITALDPVPSPPAGLPKVNPEDDNCNPETGGPTAFGLPDDRMLWGVCYATGAYNFSYRFYLTGKGSPEPLSFPVPGETIDPDMTGVLVNPAVTDGGRSIEAIALGRGLGDCGTSQTWVWNGTAFQLAGFAKMDDCRGVIGDDWPVLLTTRIE